MFISSLPNSPNTTPLRSQEFFLARQAIFDRRQSLVAYELLFRDAPYGPANIVDDLSATAAVIANTTQLGLKNVAGDALSFLNVDAAVLKSDIFQFLPREKIILEIVETVEATPAVLERVTELREQGFHFALDDVISDSDNLQKLAPLMAILKLDLCNIDRGTLAVLAPQFKNASKKILAEKVETEEQLQTCLELGCDYFQGYFLERPVILNGSTLSPSRASIVQVMSLVASGAEYSVIADAIKKDWPLCLKLLQMTNTWSTEMHSCAHSVSSLNQALKILGNEQLHRWLQILIYADTSSRRQELRIPEKYNQTSRENPHTWPNACDRIPTMIGNPVIKQFYPYLR